MIRAGIRHLLRERLAEIAAGDATAAVEISADFIDSLRSAPLALLPERPDEQHYELPAAFFAHALGRHRKYSSRWWPEGVKRLDKAEAAALAMTCERARLADGQVVLGMGCSWGSLTLWMARHCPANRITAVSNSQPQREHIESELAHQGLRNVEVITCDINEFMTSGRYDRIVSVEMFEHLRNWQEASLPVRSWLRTDGCFSMHAFVHRLTPYAFVARDDGDWMSYYFFAGGMMPRDIWRCACRTICAEGTVALGRHAL